MLRFTSPDIGQNARRLRLDTVVRLRWLAVAGQTGAVLVVHFGLRFPLPLGACLLAIAVLAGVNAALSIRYRASYRLGDEAATLLLGFDVLQLAALLYLTGGLQNPFAVLFLAPVLISATALPPERTLILGLLAIGCATVLAIAHRPVPWFPDQELTLAFLYVAGIWTAILLGIAFTAVYAWRVAEEGRQLAQALAATELVLAREQHLSQLDGLAAAAAHELGTPLATIALVVKELERQSPSDPSTVDDLKLLREQVDRCRLILSKLTSLGEDPSGVLGTMKLGHLIEEVVAPHRSFDVPIDVETHGDAPEPACARNPGLIYALANLVDNAVDFAASKVLIRASWTADEVKVEIRDDGPGFSPEVLLRVGEPYVTTRGRQSGSGEDGSGGDGSGLGLGLFIAKTLIERSGAQLSFANASPPGSGAVARVVWPRTAYEGERPRLPASEAVTGGAGVSI